jgi:hypothetical protein
MTAKQTELCEKLNGYSDELAANGLSLMAVVGIAEQTHVEVLTVISGYTEDLMHILNGGMEQCDVLKAIVFSTATPTLPHNLADTTLN